MNVYSYYAPVAGMETPVELIDLWRSEWERQGWNPIVLNEDDAKRHTDFESFEQSIRQLPTVNSPDYERSCYMRHLAMAERGGLLTDYDVMPRAFTPSDCIRVNAGRELTMLEPTRVPCAVVGTNSGFQSIVDFIKGYQLKPQDRYAGRLHVSDMEILRKSQFQIAPVCVEHLCSGKPVRDDPGDGWLRSPLIHFSSFSFNKSGQNGPKHKLIRQVLDSLPPL